MFALIEIVVLDVGYNVRQQVLAQRIKALQQGLIVLLQRTQFQIFSQSECHDVEVRTDQLEGHFLTVQREENESTVASACEEHVFRMDLISKIVWSKF